MPILDYLNESRFLDRPFEANNELPTDLVVDAQFFMPPRADWSYTDDVLRLTEISDEGSRWGFHLSGSGLSFLFLVDKDAPLNTTIFASEVNGGELYGWGFLQFGDLSNAVQSIFLDVRLIPTHIQNLRNFGVNSLNVANKTQTLYTDDCTDADSSSSGYADWLVEAEGLDGEVVFAPGRWTVLDLIPTQNALVFRPARSVDEGGETPCEPIRVLPPEYDPSLEPSCADLLFTINGVSPDATSHILRINGSRAVSVTPNGSELTVTINPLVIFPPTVDGSCA
jgi:hypothetical protein